MSAARSMRWAGALAAGIALVLVSAQISPSAVTLPQAASPPDPQSVNFTVAANDPLVAQGVMPADILSAGGNAAILCDDLGLLCVDPITSDYDVIGGLSYGQDFVSTEDLPIQFSVDQGSLGAAGTAVRVEAACSPGEPQADVFAPYSFEIGCPYRDPGLFGNNLNVLHKQKSYQGLKMADFYCFYT